VGHFSMQTIPLSGSVLDAIQHTALTKRNEAGPVPRGQGRNYVVLDAIQYGLSKLQATVRAPNLGSAGPFTPSLAILSGMCTYLPFGSIHRETYFSPRQYQRSALLSRGIIAVVDMGKSETNWHHFRKRLSGRRSLGGIRLRSPTSREGACRIHSLLRRSIRRF